MSRRLPEITIQRDTREKVGEGWIWEPEEKKPGRVKILGTETKKLDQGDYAIQGHEDLCVIERKAGVCELFGNLMNKTNRERFERELERLLPVKHKYIVIETSINRDIWGMSIGQYRNGPPGSRVVEQLIKYQMEFGIIPIFAGDCGKKIASRIFRTVAREEL